MASKNYFITGVTELLLLTLLLRKDGYVYDVAKSVQELSGGLLSISPNTIYTVAYKLEQEGYISEYTKQVGRKRMRVYYRVEPAGRAYLEKICLQYQQVSGGVERFLRAAGQMEREDGHEDGN